MDISISSTKIRGRPKGRPNIFNKRYSKEIPKPFTINVVGNMRNEHLITNAFFRTAEVAHRRNYISV